MVTFGLIACGCLILGLLLGYLVATFRHGPFEAFFLTAHVVFQAVPDFLRISPRRVVALARLAVKEAFRRKVVLALIGVFSVALLFGGWFFDTGSDHPERTYIGIVSWGTQLLILMMGLLVSSFSLPEDLRNKTIHTVVTKPVRPTEILLGRILGFVALSTALLAIMATVCLLFVWRGLAHTHGVEGSGPPLESFEEVDRQNFLAKDGRRVSESTVKTGATTLDGGHRHRLRLIQQVVRPGDPQPSDLSDVADVVEADGVTTFYRVVVDPYGGHTHPVTVRGRGSEARISLEPAKGFFRARVPIYADALQFTDRAGVIQKEGINVGDQWSYRGYIVGGASLSKAMFDYSGLRAGRFRDAQTIDLEMTLGVYRSYKGTVDRRVLASVSFESLVGEEDEGLRRVQTDPFPFESVEFETLPLSFPRRMIGRVLDDAGNVVATEQELDFFKDLAANGRVRVVLRCEERSQYIGVGRADLYFRASEKPYVANFYQGFLGTWLQTVIVVSLGVCLSTFLATPVTMFATIVVIIIGFNADFIRQLVLPDADGGGPIEAFVRNITQANMQTPFTPGPLRSTMEFIDDILLSILNSLTYIVPDFARLDFSNFIQYGYWIDVNRLLVAAALTFSFCLGLFVLGYFCLKTREIAA